MISNPLVNNGNMEESRIKERSRTRGYIDTLVNHLPTIMVDESIEYLYDHQLDSEWAAIVLEDPDKIIKDFSEEEWPEVCKILAPTIGNLVLSEDYKDRKDEINEKAMRITRIGLNTVRILESQDGFKKNEELRKHSEELYINYATALASRHRYIASFEYLTTAQLSLANKIRKSERALLSKTDVMGLYCYGKRAEFWAMMSIDLPPQVAADYLFYADIRTEDAITYLSILGCDQYRSEFIDVRNYIQEMRG